MSQVQCQLPEVWTMFAQPKYDVVKTDPFGPAPRDDDPQPRQHDFRQRVFKVKRFEFRFRLQSDEHKYWILWAIFQGKTQLLVGQANPDALLRLDIDIRDKMYKVDGLREIAYDFDVVWTTDKPHADICGVHLAVGDYIIYAANGGRSAILKFGRITKLTYSGGGGARNGYADCAVQAVTVDDWGNDKLQNNGKPVTLTFMSRIVQIDQGQVPKQFLQPLDEAYRKAVQ